jgi:hypothetical protein
VSATYADLDSRIEDLAPALAILGWRLPRVRDPAIARRFAHGLSLCAAHHLHGIHGGRIRVFGRAPDGLVWEFGLRRSYAQTAVP